MQNATTLTYPDDNSLFTAEVAQQKNVLLLGKSGSGKTTLLETLKNASFKTPKQDSFFAKGALEPHCTSLVVRNLQNRAYSINIIDTPGFFEIRDQASERRTNAQISKLIQECVQATVTNISAVFILIPLNEVMHEEDMSTIQIAKDLLGDIYKKNTFLIFTKADMYQVESLHHRITEFLECDVSSPFLDFCRGGIYFSGTINGELVAELGEAYENKIKSKVVSLRQCLIETIVATDDVKVDFHSKHVESEDERPKNKEKKKT